MNSANGKLSAIQLAVTTAALQGDAGAIYHVARGLLGEGMPLDSILFEVLAPVQAAIGHRWQFGDYLISEEHAATSAVETVVSLLAGSLEQPDDGVHIVVAAVQGDTHSLPGRLIAADLLYRGFRTTLLGATMPADDLRRYLADEEPEAVVLTCAMSMHLPGAAASIEACHAAAVPVLVGGHAFGPDGAWATQLGADGWVPDLSDVADKLDTWVRDKPAAADSSAEAPAGLVEFSEARPLYVTGAASALAAQGGGAGVRYYDELQMLFDVLVAAMTVDDDSVIVEFTGWLAALLDASGKDPHDVASIVAALKAVVEPRSPDAGRRLAAAAAELAGG